MKGVDISHYQKGLTIRQIKDAGNEFAIIKVTEGSWLRDGAAVDFYREAYETGFPVGCYCYSHATTVEDAANEAYFLLDTINRFPMPCGVFLDMEEPKQLGMSKEKLLAIIAAWGNVIHQAGYIPGIYSSAGTLWAKISKNEIGDKCLVWVAKWSQTPPDMPCDLWQTSDSGRVDGYDGPVDTDETRGSRLEGLIRSFAGYRPAEKPPDAPEKPENKTDISGAMSLLAAYLQTPEFQQDFLNFINNSRKAD